MIELHSHLGGAVPSAVLWEILCDSGLQSEFDSFDNLHRFLSVTGKDITNLDEFLGRYFHSTELIQSSPHAISTAAYHAVAKAYRRANITGFELRYNPLKRLHGGRHTLGAVIMSSIQGLQRVSMHYKVPTGIIFTLAKEFTHEQNQKIVDAAISFRGEGSLNGAHGVIGLDMAGPESKNRDTDVEWLTVTAKMFEEARRKGLGITWHVGETDQSGPDGIEKVLDIIKPDRIGHGIQLRKATGKQLDKICFILKERNVCLEICPSVNKVTHCIDDFSEIADLVRMLDKEGIPFCLNTDNAYLIHTNLQREYDIIKKELGNDASILDQAHEHAKNATFLKDLKISDN